MRLYSFYSSTIKLNHWVKPIGFDTEIKIFSCIAKKKVPLVLKKEGTITWYTCGPTVYDDAHIGHAACYLKLDMIQRILSNYFKFDLITAMNITDVDDKIIKKSLELNKPFNTIASIYENNFWNDLSLLRIKKPDIILRVSENIPCIINFIKILIDCKSAYKSQDGSVYFDVEGLPVYGKLVNVDRSSIDKKNSMNCALWKSSETSPSWDSPWGKGRPGWHIECSALASKLFGSSIDIHGGGMDLKFPHHENEEAHSCVYHNTDQWVNYWIHIGQLQHSNSSEKMSKSLKNTISIKSLLQKTTPDGFRLACLMSHYRSRMEYSEELLNMANKTLQKYRSFLNNCDSYLMRNSNINNNSDSLDDLFQNKKELHSALCDDFDTPKVINLLNRLVKNVNSRLNSGDISVMSVISMRKFVTETLNLFGIQRYDHEENMKNVDENEIVELLKTFRYNVRRIGLKTTNSDILKLCDELRTIGKTKGIEIRDDQKTTL